MSAIKNTLAAGLAALTLGTATISTSTPAAAWWRGGYGFGAPVAAGVIGGLAAGAILGSAIRPYGYGPAYAYGPAPCVRRRPVYDAYGNFAGYRPVRIC